MDTLKSVYLSLGSNMGNRLGNLQKALELISIRIGRVEQVSPVYETVSFGFEGDDFYNICVKIKTVRSPENLLDYIFKIETKLGRIRKETNEYESRPIDIDILFYEKEIVETSNLQIPHPNMCDRDFVMFPLSDITNNFVHPTKNITVEEIKSNIAKGNIKTIDKTLTIPVSLMDKYSYIAIEGNIGSGKTTLSNMISADFNGRKILERFADNPFLPLFYENPKRYAFTLEMSFLTDRHQQISENLLQLDLFKSFVISDYFLFKSLTFAQITLQEDEYGLYRKIFDILYKEITKPTLYVYLHQNTDNLLKNIKKRGRDYEQNIEPSYLDKINKGYLNFIDTHTELNSIIIDTSKLDFVKNEEDYFYILERIVGV